MKIYLMTDLEGVAGVLDYENWCEPPSRYYEVAKELLTLEANAAASGFFDAGATEVVVADGHGWGGIDPRLIDSRVELMKGWPGGWPQGLDGSFDAVAWVGQHARAGTAYAHIAHTQDWKFIDVAVNGLSVGEFGQTALCANELGIRSIFASGDEAFTMEARELFPGIETVSVKRGTTPGSGDELTCEEYSRRNYAAVHLPPERARKLIYEGAARAIKRAREESFGLIDFDPPYELIIKTRPGAGVEAGTQRVTHPSSVAALMNAASW